MTCIRRDGFAGVGCDHFSFETSYACVDLPSMFGLVSMLLFALYEGSSFTSIMRNVLCALATMILLEEPVGLFDTAPELGMGCLRETRFLAGGTSPVKKIA
jgi:hypothetical protein